ncbi:BRCA1-associated protein-like isoform X1 [Homarus americanus]|uniref:BRCA1-associated protein-like isoform X1 n=1 Tax=Homarus americanus TaxID=6706 RepID=UPI001C43D763|nr:BRCA1-associated protein-like isoform X1 [Homarus americanus]
MSVSLVVLRLETADDSPTLKHIEYQGPKSHSRHGGTDREASPSEWPPLVTDTLLSIHRGHREPTRITVTTLEEQHIIEALAAASSEDQEFDMDFQAKGGSTDIAGADTRAETGNLSSGGVLPRTSKESTPCASSSKEGTPGLSEDSNCSSRRGRSGKDRVTFVSGNPMVDVTHGILHLYKENTKTSLDETESRSEMLCMLAVPTSMTIHDLLQFTAPCYSVIQHMRIIRDPTPNQYMVLLKFRTQGDADMFYNTFNGQRYNSIEPDICRLVYVARVETTKESENGGLPIPGHTELPNCPVCLERMDESVDGILTILCNHSFHGECLAKWGDTSHHAAEALVCPVCRYCQTPEETPDQRCSLCGSADSLWICLICGHVGCGRYVGGHAHRHFMETNHLFALQVGNNRVWDYVRDNYVHRLLQSEGDGKVVSYERSSPVADTKEEMVQGEEKLTALQLEYTHLLSSQLESQRQYFENKIAEAQSGALQEAEDCRCVAKKLTEDMQKLKQELVYVTRDKQTQDKKLQQMNQKITKLTKDLETEQQLNLSMRQGKQEWVSKVVTLQTTLEQKDKRIVELESQVVDVMAHLEALSTVNSNPELQGGKLYIPSDTSKSHGARRKHRK